MMDLKKTCLGLYAAFAVSALMQFSFITILIGCAVMLAALVVAYARREAARDTIYESHLAWLIRTFWIGSGVYLPVLTLGLCFAMVATLDFSSLMTRVANGEITDPVMMQEVLKAEYGGQLVVLTLIFTLPFLGWWLWRCYAGWKALKAGEPVRNPKSWL
jgi:uncharacterized membrane protein